MAHPQGSPVGRRRWLPALALAVAVSAVGTGVAGAAPRPFGDAKVLAQVPTPPGFPEGIAVSNNLVWVSGPATFGTAGQGPSKVLLYSALTGTLLKTFDTKGENLAQEHANSSVALDRLLRAYVLNTQLGVYRLTLAGQQEQYSTPFPDLKPCSAVPANTACSPTPFDAPALPNDLAFDAPGNLYVTDSLQATIWRVPRGGGVPQIWFQDARLASASFGPNGIRLDPGRTKVYFTVTADLANRAYVYTLPLVAKPAAGRPDRVPRVHRRRRPRRDRLRAGGPALRHHRHALRLRHLHPRAQRLRGRAPGQPGQPDLPLRLARQPRLRREGLRPGSPTTPS